MSEEDRQEAEADEPEAKRQAAVPAGEQQKRDKNGAKPERVAVREILWWKVIRDAFILVAVVWGLVAWISSGNKDEQELPDPLIDRILESEKGASGPGEVGSTRPETEGSP